MSQSITPPHGTPEYAYPMWAAAVAAAANTPDIVDAFVRETGTHLPGSQLEFKIDLASGHGVDIARAFVGWFNKNVWGAWDGPGEDG